ncbi:MULTISPECIES: VanZ family protein [Paenibacillus]|uniref:VanZ family protein n=1 Tax=Paenibacillus rhizoplanae TaxID=1917181 RepID=A0ABW5F799_9BACL|nr:VanZ family protein [Paenibacillus odorifer]OME45158.1 teicoplanin resistance protein VanZ [Paenibacillus odorifer]
MSIQYTIESYYVLAPLFLIFLVTLLGLTKLKIKRFTALQYTLLVTFGFYLLAVFHLVLFPIDVNIGLYANQTPWYKHINFIPILTIDIKTFILNIIMLVPLGMYLPLLNRKYDNTKKAAKLVLILSLSIEVIQMVIGITLGSSRSTDINDIIANTLGGVLGFLIMNKLMQANAIQRFAAKFNL